MLYYLYGDGVFEQLLELFWKWKTEFDTTLRIADI